MQKRMPDLDEGGHHAWMDIVNVTVPAKTKRKTVIARAVEQSSSLVNDAVLLRVIPAEHADVIPVEMEQPPPQLKIG